jgi:hypothetical protein
VRFSAFVRFGATVVLVGGTLRAQEWIVVDPWAAQEPARTDAPVEPPPATKVASPAPSSAKQPEDPVPRPRSVASFSLLPPAVLEVDAPQRAQDEPWRPPAEVVDPWDPSAEMARVYPEVPLIVDPWQG